MRKILLLLFLPLAMASPFIQTFKDMGVHPVVTSPEVNRVWILPYELPENCTPFIILDLISGRATVYNNGKIAVEGEEPGTYRGIIDRNGEIKITLERKEGEARAEIDDNSFIGCANIPFLEVNAEVPSVFSAGGYSKVKIRIRNRGTGNAEARIVLRLPEELAPVFPPETVDIAPLSEREEDIVITAVEEFSPRLFHPICVEYEDSYGKWGACTDEYITEGKEDIPAACFIHNGQVSIINQGTKALHLSADEILPRDMQTYGIHEVNWQDICDSTVKIEKEVLEPIEDYSWLSALFLSLSGVLGVTISEKRIKTRKA